MLSEADAASVGLVVRQARKGVRSGTRCIAPSARHHKGKRCTRRVTLWSFSATISSPTTRLHFSGIVKGRRLKAGSYTLTATPRRGTAAGRTRVASFVVLR